MPPNHRHIFTPMRPHPPPSDDHITRQIIGVAVPRKARSASLKRTHEIWVCATLEEQSFENNESVPPSSSAVSPRKKMKQVGPKTPLPKASKSSSSTQEDIEFQIAELLSGLKDHESSSLKLEPSTAGPSSILSTDAEMKKVEDNNSSALAPNDSTQFAKVEKLSPELNVSSLAAKKDNEERKFNSGAGFSVAPDGRSEFIGESQPCSKSKLDIDKQEGFSSTRDVFVVPEDKGQRADKFEIDLMAPPPMMLSPTRDNLSSSENGVKVEDKVEKEKTEQDIHEVKMDVLTLSLGKPNKQNDARTNNKLEEQGRNKEQPTKSTNPREEKIGQSSSVPLSIVVQEQPINLSSMGSMSPLTNVAKTEKPIGLSTAPHNAGFLLSQSQAKRCATHHYIAHNIILHQQCAKMKPFLPSSAVSSGSLCDTKHININRMPSTESSVVGKHSQKHLPDVNQNATQEKGYATTGEYSLVACRSSAPANPTDSAQMKQLVLQGGPHPGSTGNLVRGHAFPYQASVAGGVNLTIGASSPNKSHSSVAGSLGTSSTLPAVTASMRFSDPNLAANDAPFMTVVQNGGYPFPFSTPLGASAATKGASPVQSTPLLNGPLYSSKMFHPFQHPQQHLNSHALVQPSYPNANVTSGSSSSHKQSQETQVKGNNHENGMAGENAPSLVNGKAYSRKNVFGQNLATPVQPLPNLSFRPSGTSDSVGGNNGNFGDKQQQPQALQGRIDRIPSQPYAISYAAFNGTSVPSNLNLSSIAQNPVTFRSLSDMTWQGYQAVSASHIAQQKVYSTTEGKSGGSNSSHQDDDKKATSCNPSTNGPKTLVFDHRSKNLDFVSSPINGNWPSRPITSTSTTISLPLANNASNSQQPPPQLLHFQQQHAMLLQQPAMATQYKASSTNAKFSSNQTIFSPTLDQFKSSNQVSQSKNSGKTLDSQVHNASIITSTPIFKSLSQEQGRVLQGHTQISFGGSYIPSLLPQGQQLLDSNHPFGTTVAGTPPNEGNLKNSQGTKLVSLVSSSQMQQTGNSPAGTGQQSSLVCGRNVPSILS